MRLFVSHIYAHVPSKVVHVVSTLPKPKRHWTVYSEENKQGNIRRSFPLIFFFRISFLGEPKVVTLYMSDFHASQQGPPSPEDRSSKRGFSSSQMDGTEKAWPGLSFSPAYPQASSDLEGPDTPEAPADPGHCMASRENSGEHRCIP